MAILVNIKALRVDEKIVVSKMMAAIPNSVDEPPSRSATGAGKGEVSGQGVPGQVQASRGRGKGKAKP